MRNNLFIIDTNILISSALFKYGTPRMAVTKANQTGKLLASIETYNEFKEALLRPKFDKYLSRETRLEILLEFKKLALFSKTTVTISDCRDPKDNKFLELAVSAGVSCIISGDKDLLELHPFREIPILNAVDFKKLLIILLCNKSVRRYSIHEIIGISSLLSHCVETSPDLP